MVPTGPATYVKRSLTTDENGVVTMKRLYVTMAILLLSDGLALAQGQGLGPGVGVNPSNSQDLTNRSNPQNLTLPGASDRQDLVREPALPRATSPAPSFGNGIRSGPLR